jgi:hypothetical protein
MAVFGVATTLGYFDSNIKRSNLMPTNYLNNWYVTGALLFFLYYNLIHLVIQSMRAYRQEANVLLETQALIPRNSDQIRLCGENDGHYKPVED